MQSLAENPLRLMTGPGSWELSFTIELPAGVPLELEGRYAAVRRRLERGMVCGTRKAKKALAALEHLATIGDGVR